MRPCKLPVGSARQARPVWSRAATDPRGAVIGVGEFAPDPGTALTGSPPVIVAVAEKMRSFFAAPTVMADGDVPGEEIVFGSGPSFPATTTTITPSWAALSRACAWI